VAVVQQPIEDRRRHDWIGEHRSPLGDAPVRRDQHGAGLIAPADQLQEQMRRVGLERQVTEFIDDQQFCLGVAEQLLIEPLFAVRLGEAGDQCHRRRELDAVAGEDRFLAERDGEMRLADARRPEQQHVLAVGDPARGRQVAHLPRVDRRLRLEVEACQVLHCREVRELERHLDAPMIFPRDLAFAQHRQRLACRQVRAGGFVEQAVEPIADAGELQPHQHLVEPVGRHMRWFLGAGHQKLPPIAASYSASGRSSVGNGGS
jgi:hypothetical protein